MKDETGGLFSFNYVDSEGSALEARQPLADRMRPRSLDEFVGQEHLLGPGRLLRESITNDRLFSVILWGPPGSGKTALARIIAHHSKSLFVSFSAVLSGVKEIRDVLHQAAREWAQRRRRTILFVDEIHRFNKAQQDAFLPHVESGRIILIGATTENPSFEVNAALLSRMKVLVLKALSPQELEIIITRALKDPVRGLGGRGLEIEKEAIDVLCTASQGDARQALNALELAAAMVLDSDRRDPPIITTYHVGEAFQRKTLMYDKEGEEHYNLASAFIKSLRGSDPDAALYWMMRMLEAGEDPLFIARRMVIFASEDIGNADPRALQIALGGKEAVHFVGMPEATITLSHIATYLATAPKSNAAYLAGQEAQKAVHRHGTLPVPLHLRNAPTKLMKEMGYSQGYQYPHDAPEGFVPEQYLPDVLRNSIFYDPTTRGYEKEIRKRLEHWRTLRKGIKGETP